VTGADADTTALSAGMRASLAALKDIGGVTGSFVCTPNGRVVAREISPLFEDGVLAEAGSRLVRLRETFAAGGDELEVGVVRFRDHRIYMKSVGDSLLCILAEGAVNMPALRMAANLVGRRIGAAVVRMEAEPEPPPVRAPALPPPPAEPPRRAAPEAPPGMRRFRGRAVD
jgi:predicted regulator of Ras-like GTPase activity (Roadblock/LC7/MglB family)